MANGKVVEVKEAITEDSLIVLTKSGMLRVEMPGVAHLAISVENEVALKAFLLLLPELIKAYKAQPEVIKVLEEPKPEPEPHSEPEPHPVTNPEISRFSIREREIIKALANGDSNKLIARQLDITESTVKVHVKSILRKGGMTNRTQMAIWGLQHSTEL